MFGMEDYDVLGPVFPSYPEVISGSAEAEFAYHSLMEQCDGNGVWWSHSRRRYRGARVGLDPGTRGGKMQVRRKAERDEIEQTVSNWEPWD